MAHRSDDNSESDVTLPNIASNCYWAALLIERYLLLICSPLLPSRSIMKQVRLTFSQRDHSPAGPSQEWHLAFEFGCPRSNDFWDMDMGLEFPLRQCRH